MKNINKKLRYKFATNLILLEKAKKKFILSIKNYIYAIKQTILKNFKKTKINLTLKISNFNISLISIISLLFFYLFYLSIPALYDKSWIQNTIENKLINEFNINFSISSEITYEILPSPHFTIRNAKILNDDPENLKTIAEIKALKIFISQKNFFDKEQLKITSVLVDKANFSIQQSDFSYYQNLIAKEFSRNKVKIKNSIIFFKDLNEETILITQISKFFLFYDDLKLLNKIHLEGKIFKIPFLFTLDKDLEKQEKLISLNSQKLELYLKNLSGKKNEIIKGINEISVLNSKLISEYIYNKNQFLFKSKKSQIRNNKINYNGEIILKPFNLILNVDLDNIKLIKLFKNDSILFEILKLDQLYHNNLNTNIVLNSSNISDNKILNNLKINFNIQNGRINFDKSYIKSNKIGSLFLSNSNLILRDGNLMINTDINIKIDNSKNFFSFFQTPKNSRKPIKNIFFNLD